MSIGLPVHNGAEYLSEAVESILAQSFTDFELILCDNASDDGTEAICRRFAGLDPRVRYIRQPQNIGAAANYNRAFHEARGRYFKWGAHDDTLAPDFLKVCVAELDRDPGCILVHCGTVLIDADGRETSCYIDCLASGADDPVERFRTWMRQPRGQCNPVFGLVRREAMAKTILHGDYIGADRVLLGDFALRGRVTMIPQGYFLRRIHPGMSTLANRNALSLTNWFAGGQARGLRFKRWRQLREFRRMIGGVETLSAAERQGARRVLLRWVYDLRSEFLKELLLPLYINGEDTALKAWMRRRRAGRRGRGAASEARAQP
ncbi:glycosyltransferase [Rhodobacterales bacterium HKCCSP123]|nr:glycosyltransferase [Rhodobacterales bacterium HKCCSP123]